MAVVKVHGRRVAGCFLLLVASLGVYHVFTLHSLADVRDRVLLRQHIARWVNDETNAKRSPSHLACQHPDLEVTNPDIHKYFHKVDALKCDPEPEWVEVKGSVAAITKQAKAQHGDITCSFTELVRVDDSVVKMGLTTTTQDTFTFANTDFYTVVCIANDGKRWKNTVAGIRIDEEVLTNTDWKLTPSDGLKLNFLMLGFDSLSRNTFIRTLPKSYAFLTEVLGAHVMEGYNIVGDGTPQQLIPMLTGKTELELPETRRRMGTQAKFVNSYPMVWDDFKRNGYVTMYAEDQPHIGTFQYRLKGFDAQPTHHYLRPFFVQVYPEFKNHPRLCLGANPRHKVFLDYVYNFMDVYRDRPKFAFAFHSELSHDDYNLVNLADDDLLSFLSNLHRGGHLNHTLLVIMSDHGHRFTAIRETQQGKQEERLPFLALTLPNAFITTYPSAADNIRMNIHRLTTPFDMHPTMQDLLHFQGARLGQVSERAISLFRQVPSSRTCADAFIEPHWCACLSWEPVGVGEEQVQRAAHALVHYMNTYTATHRAICNQLTLSKVLWAGKLLPTKGLLSYKKSSDVDGFVPDLTDKTAVSEIMYQVTVVTKPGQGRYEASLTYSMKQDTFSLKLEDVSRTNKYGDQAHCVTPTIEHLRKFCYCREPPPPPPQEYT